MGYDYSMKSLMRHEEEVLLLIEAWKNGETLRLDSTDGEALTRYQRLIRSLLASIDMNYSDCSGIRKQRTWISRDYKTGVWTLFVGRGIDKLSGRRPTEPFSGNSKLIPAKLTTDTVIRAADAAAFMVDIVDNTGYTALINFIISEMERGTKTITATAVLRPTEQNQHFFFNSIAQMGWSCYIEPTPGSSKVRLILRQDKEPMPEDDVTRAFDEELRKLQGELP